MDNLTLGKKIKQAREAKGVTLNDIAEKIGVAKSTIQRYENGKISTPKLPVVHAIASALDVNPSWLVGKSPNMYEPVNVNRSSAVRIPVLGSVPAGIPLEAIEDVIDYEEIPSAMASKGDYFALKINGHSMEPQIMDGDVVIVLKTDDVDSGDIAIVMVNGDDATCKKILKQDTGVQLVPINPDFDPLFFTNKEIASKPVRIIGRVSEIRRTL